MEARALAEFGHDAVFRAGVSLTTVAMFLAVWQAHIAVVMLPASVPTVAKFSRVVSARPRAWALRALFLSGYFVLWTGFAVVALAGDGLLHRVAGEPSPVVMGGLLVGAGAFQFSALKARCLHVCRRPETFLRLHYRRGERAAFALGVRHGLFCLGCCWAMMLVLMAVGFGNLVWMAPLALVMAVEKTARRGAQLVRPVGFALVAIGVATAAAGSMRG